MSQAPSTARFTHVILNHCAINSIEFRNIFSNSHDTLRFLSLENPTWINHQDIAEAVEYAGKNLRRLEIESFPDEEAAALLDEEDVSASTRGRSFPTGLGVYLGTPPAKPVKQRTFGADQL